ncbi:MAG TPA: universal stress protein [Candidatus Dormibacteraeota bacterium]|nr:universal stress protein [Candidatus Dormibacteraeota bacterium]
MFKKVLVAIDSSDYSKQVVPAAIEIARKFQSNVFVLHVAEHDRGRAVVFTTESPAQATALVAQAVKEFRDAGVEADGKLHDVAVGHVAKDIAETAMALESDLIVMGSRGLSDVEGMLLGSVAHKVMHLTHTSVLVTRGPLPVKRPAVEFAPAMAAVAPAV